MQTQRAIVSALVYNKKRRGRALVRDFVALGLAKYDRLEPTKYLPDVSLFERKSVPFSVTFWKGCKEDRLVHGCPLFIVPGVTIDSWVVDVMHSWHLGDLLIFIAWVMWYFLKLGVFAPVSVYLDAEECQRLSLLRIKSEMYMFYKNKRKDPQWKRTGSEASSCELHTHTHVHVFLLSVRMNKSYRSKQIHPQQSIRVGPVQTTPNPFSRVIPS